MMNLSADRGKEDSNPFTHGCVHGPYVDTRALPGGPCLHNPYTCAHPLCTQTPAIGTHTCTLPQAWHGQAMCRLFVHSYSNTQAWSRCGYMHTHAFCMYMPTFMDAESPCFHTHTHTYDLLELSSSSYVLVSTKSVPLIIRSS